MPLDSLQFAIFLLVTWIIYWFAPNRFKSLPLIFSGIIFIVSYGQSSLLFFTLVALITLVSTKLLGHPKTLSKKIIYIFSIISILVLLIVAKYSQPLNHNLHQNLPPIAPIIGISFYSLFAIAVITDTYLSKLVFKTHTLLTSLSFFATITAGPIEPTRSMLEQTRKLTNPLPRTIVDGLRLVIYGLFLKVVIADRLAYYYAKPVFENLDKYTGLVSLQGLLAYTFQIYFDFAGYSHIVRGIAKFFNLNLTVNFNFPYFSKTPNEFWLRWHISLTRWLQQYVFIPLGGSRKHILQTLINIFIVFIISGLWHGGTINFLVWGIYHACLIIGFRLLAPHTNKLFKFTPVALTNTFLTLITFSLISFGWIFFNTPTPQIALRFIHNIATPTNAQLQVRPDIHQLNLFLFICVAICEIVLYHIGVQKLIRYTPTILRYLVYLFFTLCILNLGIATKINFIYLRF